MDGINLLFDLPPESTRQNGKRSRAFPGQRRSVVREKLMVLLTEPRTVKEIAVGANRTSSNITGHLRAMRRKNLVVRLSWGVWVRRDKCANVPDYASIRRNNPAQERLLAHLREPKSLTDLMQLTGLRGDNVMQSLKKMAKRGEIEQRQDDLFAAVRK